MLDTLLQLTLALSLAALFGAAALHKLRLREQWPELLRQYRVLPEGTAGIAAVLLPLAEGLTAALLLWPRGRTAGALVAAALLLAYAGALALNLRRGRSHIDCGCFGSHTRAGIAPWMVGRNCVLALLALALLLPTGRVLAPVEYGFALLFAATLALLYPALDVVMQTGTHRA